MVRQRESEPHAKPHEQAESGALQNGHRGAVCGAEQHRGGFHANLHVVLAIHHRVKRVVADDPQEAGGKQQPRLRGNRAGHRRERHGDAPTEGDAQRRLRPVRPALAERVGHRHRRADRGQRAAQGVEYPRHRGAQRAEQKQQRDRAGEGNLAGRQRAAAGALHRAVETPVRNVVDNATGAAGEKRAGNEGEQHAEAGYTFRRHPKRRKRWPQQQQRAHRPVKTHQPQIRAGAAANSGGFGYRA